MPDVAPSTALLTPRLLSAAEAAAYLNISARAFVRLGVGRVRLGVRILYDRVAIDAWLDGLSAVDSRFDSRPSDDPEAALARFLAREPDAARRP